MGAVGRKGQRVRPAAPPPVHKVPQALRVPTDRTARSELKDRRANPVRRDPPEPTVKMARMVQRARLARKVTPVRRVWPVRKGTWALKALRVRKALKVPRVRRVV
jgi:hypothetical protein